MNNKKDTTSEIRELEALLHRTNVVREKYIRDQKRLEEISRRPSARQWKESKLLKHLKQHQVASQAVIELSADLGIITDRLNRLRNL